MKRKGAVTGGLINGLIVGLAAQWVFISSMYLNVYDIKLSPTVITSITSIAFVLIFIGLLTIGPHAVIRSKEAVETKRAGFRAGMGAGVVCAVVVYLACGSLWATSQYGTLPLVALIATKCEALNSIESRELGNRLMKEAFTGTYLLLFWHVLFGAVVGGVEGFLFAHLRSGQHRRKE